MEEGLPGRQQTNIYEPEFDAVLTGEHSIAFEEMMHNGRPVLDVSLPLHGDASAPGHITGILHLVMPYRALRPLTRQLLITFGLSALLLASLIIVPLWLYLERSLLRPLRVLTTANQVVAAGRSEGRLIPASAMPAHELGQAMRSRNAMLSQLEATDAALRRRLRELSALNSTAALLSEPLDRSLGKLLEFATGHFLRNQVFPDLKVGELLLVEHSRVRNVSLGCQKPGF